MRCRFCLQQYDMQQQPHQWGTCPICEHRETITTSQSSQFSPLDTIRINNNGIRTIERVTPHGIVTLVSHETPLMQLIRNTAQHLRRTQPEFQWMDDELTSQQTEALRDHMDQQNYAQIFRTPAQLDQVQQSAAMAQQINDNSVWRMKRKCKHCKTEYAIENSDVYCQECCVKLDLPAYYYLTPDNDNVMTKTTQTERNPLWKLHRENGPAIELRNGYAAWYYDGKLHRDDGPAVIQTNGKKELWEHGKQYLKRYDPLIRFSRLEL